MVTPVHTQGTRVKARLQVSAFRVYGAGDQGWVQEQEEQVGEICHSAGHRGGVQEQEEQVGEIGHSAGHRGGVQEQEEQVG